VLEVVIGDQGLVYVLKGLVMGSKISIWAQKRDIRCSRE
jgi:hypothetical protein